MKVLFMSTYDITGGAGKGAFRLFKGMQNLTPECYMLVQHKRVYDNTIFQLTDFTNPLVGNSFLRSHIEILSAIFFPHKREVLFSPSIVPEHIYRIPIVNNSSLIHLHWITHGFLLIENLQKFRKSIIWTLHDMWAFTGGCHYTLGCQNYLNSCGKCPVLGSLRMNDLSKWSWKRKNKSWRDLNLSIVTPSKWLGNCAKRSSLFKDVPITVIPNGLNTNFYKPYDKIKARRRLSLPEDKKLILFGADFIRNPRKGLRFLFEALFVLKDDPLSQSINLVIFGIGNLDDFPQTGIKTHLLNWLEKDSSLVMAYSAADVFVCPSIQENLSNTVMEALACGTPCVAFRIGGMPDLIEHQKTGYLAQPFQVEDLARGILWALENDNRWIKLSHNSRAKVKSEFELSKIVRRYFQLYKESVI
ncbi:MAG: glycosyltransferase family 4 protein [Candidatus Hodarchaeota archaeon]